MTYKREVEVAKPVEPVIKLSEHNREFKWAIGTLLVFWIFICAVAYGVGRSSGWYNAHTEQYNLEMWKYFQADIAREVGTLKRLHDQLTWQRFEAGNVRFLYTNPKAQ